MRILTFDTSTDLMYTGLCENNEIISERLIESTRERYSSALLIPTIIEILKENNLSMSDIGAIGINTGPGSFTGIRASVTVAKIFGQHLSVPVIGVSSLEIISLLNNSSRNSLCLMDARRGKAYMAEYFVNGKVKNEPCLISYQDAIDLAFNKDNNIYTDDKMYLLLMKENDFGNRLSNVTTMLTEFNMHKCTFGHNLIKLTNKYLSSKNGEKLLWHSLKPLYIQSPAITMPKVQ